jgi:4-hydroxybenzoate polyprenyltransferase
VTDKPKFAELLKKLFWSSRPISWINTAYPFGAAYIWAAWLRDGAIHLDANFWIGALFFLIPYNLLMYGLNDVFDYESDLKNPRKGGIEGALLEPRWHRPMTIWSIASCIPFLSFFALTWNLASLIALAGFVFTVIAYSAKGLRFKEIPLFDSITSASHFVGPMIVGLLAAGGDLERSFGPLTWYSIAAFTFWGMASHAFGAIQDIKADREAGIASIATALGARRTARFVVALYAAATISVLFVATNIVVSTAFGVVGILYIRAARPALDLTDDECEQANRGWRKFLWLNMIAGFVVTIALILAMLPAN